MPGALTAPVAAPQGTGDPNVTYAPDQGQFAPSGGADPMGALQMLATVGGGDQANGDTGFSPSPLQTAAPDIPGELYGLGRDVMQGRGPIGQQFDNLQQQRDRAAAGKMAAIDRAMNIISTAQSGQTTNLPLLAAGAGMLKPTYGGIGAAIGNAAEAAVPALVQQRGVERQTAGELAQLGIEGATVPQEQTRDDLEMLKARLAGAQGPLNAAGMALWRQQMPQVQLQKTQMQDEARTQQALVRAAASGYTADRNYAGRTESAATTADAWRDRASIAANAAVLRTQLQAAKPQIKDVGGLIYKTDSDGAWQKTDEKTADFLRAGGGPKAITAGDTVQILMPDGSTRDTGIKTTEGLKAGTPKVVTAGSTIQLMAPDGSMSDTGIKTTAQQRSEWQSQQGDWYKSGAAVGDPEHDLWINKKNPTQTMLAAAGIPRAPEKGVSDVEIEKEARQRAAVDYHNQVDGLRVLAQSGQSLSDEQTKMLSSDPSPWIDARTKAITGAMRSARDAAPAGGARPAAAPGGAPAPAAAAPRPPSPPKGAGTPADPYSATTQAEVDWFKENAAPGAVIDVNGQRFTKPAAQPPQ